ncbi:hypothetical protein [Kocuria arenosa]|uniref:hypothetical protein n=1 Tax=Kocuria arenosa TaxID=3071446 RepID=UPI0034D5D617
MVFLGVFNTAYAMPQSLAPFAGAWLLTVGVAGGAPDDDLLLGAAAAAALAGALIVLPIEKAK